MKKLLLLLVLVGFSATAQLSTKSKYVKTEEPEMYSTIKAMAVEKWDDNHEMVVYTINNQIEAMLEVVLKEDKAVLRSAMIKWTEGSLIGCIQTNTCETNWEMVLYEYNNQVEAKSSY